MKEHKITYWCKVEKIPNTTGKYNYVKGDIPSTRYVILFNLYNDITQISLSKSLYDDKDECFAECDELDMMYKDHPLPIIKEQKWNGRYPRKNNTFTTYDFSDGKSWWGYIVLDFEQCKIIRVGGYGFKTKRSLKINPHKSVYGVYKLSEANALEVRDYFFRNVDEVPDNYEFDDGEYEGWLQFKWGDGKNAIGYVEPPKPKKEIGFGYDFETAGLDDFNYENEYLEDKFADLLDKDTRKNLMEKFGW